MTNIVNVAQINRLNGIHQALTERKLVLARYL